MSLSISELAHKVSHQNRTSSSFSMSFMAASEKTYFHSPLSTLLSMVCQSVCYQNLGLITTTKDLNTSLHRSNGGYSDKT